MTNNNESMATVVETFYVEETTNLIHDAEALKKWNERVDELELHGQKDVVVADKSPIPFLWMNSAIVKTFETLCPTKVEIAKYDKTPIPLDLLDVVALCKREKYFDCIEVWYNEEQKDPAIVGYKIDKAIKEDWWAKSQGKKYLIGRWADVKESLDALVVRAKKMFIENTKNSLQYQIKQYQRNLEDVEQIAERDFGGAMPSTLLPF